MTLRELLADAMHRLSGVGDTPRLDAELLLAHALDRPRTHLRTWPDNCPDAEQLAHFESLLARRAGGEPIAHILGEREFWSLKLRVSPDTLIPRPDTEVLVEAALERIPNDRACRVLDLGTGTGAIALALKHERPHAEVWASDASSAALDIARSNAGQLDLDVQFREGDWWTPFTDARFDVIVSNPPYIAASDAHLETGDLRFEPRTALAAGSDGLDAIRVLVAGAGRHLLPGGWLLLEHGHDQGEAVRALLLAAGFENIGSHRDLGGHCRVSFGRLAK
ncbi:MAG: peptide chain release factor N(5)-glutamine methyltransferase [Proteobacteria bacterium]|nr:peptide chain release factor N(5)-glutamine methyltransferase [Pseudomonadota bacterium]